MSSAEHSPFDLATLVDLLRTQASRRPDALAFRFLPSGEVDGTEVEMTYGELDQRARVIGARLRGAAGRRALLLYPPGLEFVAAFFGCVYAVAVAVPAFPHHTSPRLRTIAQDSAADIVLTTRSQARIVDRYLRRIPELEPAEWIATDGDPVAAAEDWREPELTGESLAFLQYTSGSTAQPKGVMVSHANILRNERLIAEGFGTSPSTHVVGWLPLYHDMGLIGNVLQPLYAGASCTLMSPLAFLQRPVRWLRAISRFGATISGGPNFAYDLCTRRITQAEADGLDLGSWEVAFNGAEPVRAETLTRFAARFGAHGFRPEAFYPCYGLAEATLFVTGSGRQTEPSLLSVDAQALEHGEVVESGDGRVLVASGRPREQVVIVDPATLLPAQDHAVGEVWVAGPSVTRGYWAKPEENEKAFGARLGDGTTFLRTGDLGFLRGGELFVTGRLKDVVIVRGRNIYPQDVELTVERAHPAVMPAGCAAFAIEAGGEERLAITAEVELADAADADEVIEAIARAVLAEHDVSAYPVALLRPRSIPKTSSGKIQRHACRIGLRAGTLRVLACSVSGDPGDAALGSEGAAAWLPDELAAADEPSRRSLLERMVRLELAVAAQVDPARIGPDTTPASAGLDSLAAVELQARLEDLLGLSLPVGAFGAQPTAAAIVDQLVDALRTPSVRPAVPAAPDGAEPVASPGQERLWVIDQLAPGTAAYNVHFGVRIDGSLDTELLSNAITEVVRRYSVLRTVFQETDAGLRQIVRAPGPVPVGRIDLSDAPDQEKELHRTAAALAAEPFDLVTDPLLRCHLVRLGADEHVLLVVQHHTVTDGWSIGVLGRELAACYAALARGTELPSPPQRQFTDYAHWVRGHTAALDGDREFWARALAGLDRLALPGDRPRTSSRSHRGGRVAVDIPTEVAARLVALGRDEGATPFATLLCAYAVLLRRYTGQDDFTVGTVVANRNRPEFRELIGFLANTVVVRCDTSGEPSFRELLQRVRDSAAAAMAHSELPFSEIVRVAGDAGRVDGAPLFEASFVLENSPAPWLGIAGTTWRPVSWSPDGAVEGTAKFELFLALQEIDGGYGGVLEYDADRFDAATVERMAAQFGVLLTGLAGDPDRPVTAVGLLPHGELRRLLAEWNDTATEVEASVGFPELFEKQVRRRPDWVAVLHEGGEVAYRELNALANRLAHHLRAMGVGRGVVVGLLLSRGLDLLVSILAVFKAGAAYVPLDPEHPAHRHRQVLDGARVPLLIGSRELTGRLLSAADNAPWGIVYAEDIAGLQQSEVDLQLTVRPDDLAYVIFTSGSTGVPKGVMVEQLGMVNHLFAKIHDLDLDERDTVAQTASQCFDISVWQFLAALLTGGRVDIVTETTATDAILLFERAAAAGTTILEVVPSLLRAALDEQANLALPTLRWLVVTGEALPPELARRWLAQVPRIPLINAYGPTECSDDVTHYAIHGPDALDVMSTPIGRPVLNTRLYVLDEHQQPVPIGVLGELVVGGFGVGRGYAGRPDLTAERFVPDPFGPPGGRLYRTGDLARWLSDGRVEFVGRVDSQVKIRGFRIELGEIEVVLGEHPGVRDVAVVVDETPSGDRRLTGYLVLDAVDTESVREWAGSRLPSYMVPSALVVVDRLPLTPNGKLDRKALPAVTPGDVSVVDYVAPATPTEELLAAVWAQVLGVDRVGAEDDFFALGGHSLLATQVVARVRRSYGIDLPLRRLFEARTVTALARAVDDARVVGSARLPGIERVDRSGPLPVSFAQQRLWFLDQLSAGDVTYNMPGAVRIRGPLDVAALTASLRQIVRRHETLRTSFAESDSGPVQVIDPDAELVVAVTETTDIDGVVAQEARIPFDLSRAPLVRVRLVRVAEDEHVLVLVMHHIVSDGWSLGVLIREASELYRAYPAGAPASLPELGVQYADYAVWQREWLAGPVLAEQLEFWRDRLAGVPPALELPTDFPRPIERRGRGAQHPVEFDAELAEGLREVARGEGATLFMVLLAGFQTLLSRFSGQDDVVVGSPIAGRTRAEWESLIGFFVNPLVLRGDMSGDPGFRELVRRVRGSTLDAYAHQDVPFEKLVEVLAPPRDFGRTPLFQVMFVLQNVPAPDLELGDAELDLLTLDTGTAKFDLTLSLEENEQGGVAGFLEYDTDLFRADTVEAMVEALRTLLVAAVADPGRAVNDLPLLSAPARQRIVHDWNETARELPGSTIHGLFEDQVRRTPHATALIHGDRRVGYDELNRHANRIACHLARGSDAPVGVHMGRSVDLVAAQLGVLKAARAYVSLDPAYPAERLRTMVATAGISTVLVSGDGSRALATFGAAIETVDVGGPDVDAESDHDLGLAVRPDDAAYLIFTSGSTGTPNGVVGLHRGAVNRMAWMWRRYPFADGELSALKTSPNFVDSVWETFGPLLRGVPSVVLDDAVVAAPPDLLAALGVAGVTRIVLVPSLIKAILADGDDVGGRVSRLDYWTSSGETLSATVLRAFQQRLPNRTILNLYGSSEASADSLAFDATAWSRESVPIGEPIDNTRVYLLDERFQLVPAGVPGQIHLAGAGLARGYVGRPDLTAARFMPDPFGPPGRRMYRTGDLGRWTRDGRVELLGRADNQVKIRGFRIELGEVEAALEAHPAVRDVAVVVDETPAGDARLVGYVVADAAGPGPLREWVAARLPGHMVPSVLVVLDRLPLTPNGKLDRLALPTVSPDDVSAEGFVAPVTPTEELLAGIWAEILGVDRVGAADDFFALGGHSLLATQVVARVRRVFETDLPIRRLFEARTVAALARVVDDARADGSVRVPGIERVDRSGPLPMSFAQQRLWFLDQLSAGEVTYNVPGAVRIRGVLHVDALRASLREIVRRHETLRTTFVDTGSGAVQVIAPEVEFTLDIVEVADTDVAEMVAREARVPFDLARGPLLRARLVRVVEDEHVLVLVMHHIVSDGWSLSVLLREVSVLYQAFATGSPSPLPELAVQYADYAGWQREWLDGAVLDEQVGFWRDRLTGAPPALELSTDFPRPAERRGCGAQCPVKFDADLIGGLRGVAYSEGATLFMVLLAGYQVLLSRYSGQEDVLVGSPIAGRTRAELEGLIGFFVNTLVLRGDVSGDPGFRQVVGRVRRSTLDAYAHQDVPFEKLVEVLAPPRDLGRTPLFQVMFVLQNAPGMDLALPGADLDLLTVDTGTTKFDLTLSLQENDRGGVSGYLEYDTDLFRADTVEAMVEALRTLLAAAVADPDQPVADLPLLADNQRQHILRDWNDTGRELPDLAVHELFARQAERTPDATALVHGDRRVGYRELDTWAGRIAGHLVTLGLRPEAVVAIGLVRSPDSVACMLGVLKAGGAYLPLDLSAPAERVAFILADAGAEIILTDSADRFPHPTGRVVTLDEIGHPGDVSRPVPRNRLAYVMYTSGSTGRPKGVLVPHRAVSRLALSRGYLTITEADTLLHLAPPFFDAATFEIWAGLLHGATVVVADPDPLSLGDIARLLREHKVSTLWLTAPLFHQMAEHHLDALAGLRTLLAGGDVLSPKHVRTVRERLPRVRLINGYGPTENTTFTCTETVGHPRDGEPVPIGRPIDNTTIYLLDDHGQPVPVGVVGELHTGGLGLARGYLGRPDLTAERFVPDPFGPPGGRLYRTGDLARWLSDGRVEFVGRVDSQVKIRGFRIELGEIEVVLGEHPGVRDVAVVVDETPSGDHRLTGYVVAEGVDAGSLRDWTAARLPRYMVPSVLATLDRMPLTPSGKLDRAALPAVGQDEAGHPDSRPPHGPTEELLAGIWAEVLAVDQVGAADDFFALGGHSLLATQVLARVRQTFGTDLPIRRLFEAPTVAGLARLVEESRADGAARLPEIERVDRSGPLPTSFAQQRLWFLDQLVPGRAVYNVPGAVRIRGPLDVEAVRASLREIVRRHETLRTSFANSDSGPVQVIDPDAELLMEVTETTDVDGVVAREARTPFDLALGPLVRARLVRVAEDEHVLVLVMHHIVSDGWSLGVLLREVSVLYRAFAAGAPSPLPELGVQYGDYAGWQRRWFDGAVLDEQLGYWRDRLAGAPPALELPTDFPRPAERRGRGARCPVEFDADLTGGLRRIARGAGATLFMVLLAGFQAFLSRFSGQDDVLVGSSIAGRIRAELEGLIGFFVNTLVLRGDVSGDPVFREFLGRVRASTVDAYANQDVPFEKLVEVLAPPRDLARTPLFQVLFVLQNAPSSDLELGDAELEPLAADTGTAKFDLTLSLQENDQGGVSGYLEYDTDLFRADTVENMVGVLRTLLAAAVANPDRAVGDLPLHTPDQEHRLLHDGTATVRSPELAVHELFERHAARDPHALAVVGESGELSYDEVNRQANRLARRLRELDAAPEAVVGIMVEPTFELLPGVLGILKTGGAYLPLDPQLPPRRVERLLRDSGAVALLTTKDLVGCHPEDLVPVLLLDDAWETLSDRDAANLAVPVHQANAAYTIYTSGSTGESKGVVVEQRQIVNYFAAITERFGLEPGMHYAMLQALSVDSCLTVLAPALCGGGTLHVLPRARAADPEAVLAHFRRHRIDVLKIAPSHLAALLDAVPSPDLLPRHVLILGGEGSQRDWVRDKVAPLAPEGCGIRIHYGPTETTVGVLTGVPDSGDDVRCSLAPLGRPIPNTRVYLLDCRLRPVPAGVQGEIYIAGDGVARGYLGQPGKTAESFLPDPYAPQPGGRMYRSGDLGRRLADGRIEFLGRIDDQVKVRGFRIEPAEIDAVLREHLAVRGAVTVARSTEGGDRYLVSYVLPLRADTGLPGALREFLGERLPGYMVPSSVVVLDEFPLTAQGKVDLRGLPEPQAEPQRGHRRPSTLLEAQLAAIWEEVLGTGPIGADDDFFELGGHSLLAVRILTQLRRRLPGAALSLELLFRSPTVARLARALAEGSDPARTVVPIRPGGDRPPLVFVHPVGGELLPYAELSRALGDDRPILGLRAPETVDGQLTLEELAADHVRELRAAAPHGPYLLAGWSTGGLLAFEIAQQLGDGDVGLLALFDTHLPPGDRAAIAGHDDLPVLVRFAAEMGRLLDRDLSDARDRFVRLDPDQQRVVLLGILSEQGVLPTADPEPEFDRMLGVYTRNAAAVAQYRMRATTQRIALFVPSAGADELVAQWEPWTGGVDTRVVPGDHYSMLRHPFAAELAESLRTCMGDVANR